MRSGTPGEEGMGRRGVWLWLGIGMAEDLVVGGAEVMGRGERVGTGFGTVWHVRSSVWHPTGLRKLCGGKDTVRF